MNRALLRLCLAFVSALGIRLTGAPALASKSVGRGIEPATVRTFQLFKLPHPLHGRVEPSWVFHRINTHYSASPPNVVLTFEDGTLGATSEAVLLAEHGRALGARLGDLSMTISEDIERYLGTWPRRFMYIGVLPRPMHVGSLYPSEGGGGGERREKPAGRNFAGTDRANEQRWLPSDPYFPQYDDKRDWLFVPGWDALDHGAMLRRLLYLTTPSGRPNQLGNRSDIFIRGLNRYFAERIHSKSHSDHPYGRSELVINPITGALEVPPLFTFGESIAHALGEASAKRIFLAEKVEVPRLLEEALDGAGSIGTFAQVLATLEDPNYEPSANLLRAAHILMPRDKVLARMEEIPATERDRFTLEDRIIFNRLKSERDNILRSNHERDRLYRGLLQTFVKARRPRLAVDELYPHFGKGMTPEQFETEMKLLASLGMVIGKVERVGERDVYSVGPIGLH